MRTVQRTPDRALLRDAAAIAAAMVAVGASFGAIAIAYGLPAWVPFLMSTVVFAGGAQFLAVGLIAAEPDRRGPRRAAPERPPPAVRPGRRRDHRATLAGPPDRQPPDDRRDGRLHPAEEDPVRRRRTYWLIGVTLFTSWNIGTALGVLLGGAVERPVGLRPGRRVPGRPARPDPAVAARPGHPVGGVGRGGDRGPADSGPAGRAAGPLRPAGPGRPLHPTPPQPRPHRRSHRRRSERRCLGRRRPGRRRPRRPTERRRLDWCWSCWVE